MRIGIDGSCWGNNRGFGRFTRELLGAMFAADDKNHYVVLSDDQMPGFSAGANVEISQIGVQRKVTESATASDRRSLGDMLAFRRAAKSARLDVLFYPAVYSWFPPPRGLPTVVTFHDAIAEHFPELVFPHHRQRLAWNAKTWLARKSANRVLTVSQAAKAEIVRYLSIPASDIDVICEGAGTIFQPVNDVGIKLETRTRLGLPAVGRLLVYVGGFAPHKNLERLLEAFAQAIMVKGAEDLHLVMTGDPEGGGFHSIYEKLQARIAATPVLHDRVIFTGYVSDADLAAIYSDALALVLPSLSEGFGLPALEAMSCGTPVLGATDGAVMEVAGAAGISFDPLDVDDIARAIALIACDPETESALRARAIAETARNTWPTAAELTIASLLRSAKV